ncbi:helix-turn-helix transcriptional regulator [Geopsychrobacter electrodiphilus]|uniref:helix-turn-helix transcriptional regulator n=1 Tax=Geopsychrobacter electrodiphilus TaxID=225196 RepID=UPI00036AB742|nr:helix-turn-helix transcriptional regulator [Geopsychrobacter electrodiphilus]
MTSQSDLIESVYRTASDPNSWETLLRDLVKATDSRSARLLIMNTGANHVLSSLKINIDDHAHGQYTDYFVNKCPWRPELLRMAPGRLYSTYLHFSCRQREFYQTEFFNDWARKLDIHHGLCGTVYRDSRQTVQLLIQRTRDQGHYTEADTGFVNSLVPHMQHALLVAEQLAQSYAMAQATAIATENEALPFILLDENLRLAYCSQGGKLYLREKALLQMKDGRLFLNDVLKNHRLQQLLRQCLDAARAVDFQPRGGSMRLPRADRADVQLLVKPLHAGLRPLVGRSNSFVVIYCYAPDAQIRLDPELLRELYNLSAAEARVAVAMVEAPGSDEVARRCGISLHTVRSHIKSIFSKTQAKNRAELMKILLTSPARKL